MSTPTNRSSIMASFRVWTSSVASAGVLAAVWAVAACNSPSPGPNPITGASGNSEPTGSDASAPDTGSAIANDAGFADAATSSTDANFNPDRAVADGGDDLNSDATFSDAAILDATSPPLDAADGASSLDGTTDAYSYSRDASDAGIFCCAGVFDSCPANETCNIYFCPTAPTYAVQCTCGPDGNFVAPCGPISCPGASLDSGIVWPTVNANPACR